jgi:glucose-6-phosphate 1-dehydrogenase
MDTLLPTILVIFGISGDLGRRKLLPAIGHMAERDILPFHFHVLGVTRRSNVILEDLLEQTSNKEYVRNHSELFAMDLLTSSEYTRLARHIEGIKKNFSNPVQILFYLSVPPEVSHKIIELLGASGLSKVGNAKILFEKPSGFDLESAAELIEHIDRYFTPEQVYRVDHYLAKEISQSIIPFRENNRAVEETLNKDFVERIEFTASESIGTEGRFGFYEQTGALRDMIQSHLLETLTLVLIDLDQSRKQTISERRLKALQCLNVSKAAPIIRGQYEGYKEEVSNSQSLVETFVSLVLESSDPRWARVPIRLTTGKALKEKYTELKIFYKDVQKAPLVFLFKDTLGEAHEYVLSSAINSNHDLFVSSDEALETWRIIDQVQKNKLAPVSPLVSYPKGSRIDQIV